MLGEFVDDYTVKVVDVFAMPQSGTGVSVEAVDPVFQTKMLDMLKQVGRWVWSAASECAALCIAGLDDARCAGQRWWSAGTTATPALAAGCRAWTSTRSRCAAGAPAARLLCLLCCRLSGCKRVHRL